MVASNKLSMELGRMSLYVEVVAVLLSKTCSKYFEPFHYDFEQVSTCLECIQ